jgi:hypothetical protein
MSCSWLYLASLTTPESLCGQPGDPYCEEHRKTMDYLKQLDNDFKEVEETHRAVRAETRAIALRA